MPIIVPVVLCGGSGTRLWPRSRADRPKPFLPLLGEQTLYQATLDRCADRTVFDAPIVVVGKKHLKFAEPQARDIAPDAQFIVEPTGRNTAPAIALAALAMDPQDVMLVCPSDHHIVDPVAFVEAAKSAAALASEDWLVSFGIEATSPETGYGYIRRGEALGSGFRVHSFVEKPDLEKALTFLQDGNYAWNGGIFAFRAGHFIDELAAHRPQLLARTKESFDAGISRGKTFEPDEALFAVVPGESVDYAVMENTDRAAMVDAQMGWSDIGNWDALYQKRDADPAGNVIVGKGEIIDASGTMIDADRTHVTVIGVDDVIVVVDGEDVLVAARSAVQRVGQATRCKAQ